MAMQEANNFKARSLVDFNITLRFHEFYLFDEEILENEDRLEDMTSVCVGLNSIFLGLDVMILLVSKNWFLNAKWRDTCIGMGTMILELLLDIELLLWSEAL